MSAMVLALGFGSATALLVIGLLRQPPAVAVRYLRWLEHELTFLRSSLGAGRALGLQAFGLASGLTLHLLGGPLGPLLVLATLLSPLGIPVARYKRVQRLDTQVEGWLGALGRALEASPSLGEALSVSAEMVDAPLRDEVEQTLSELHLGLPMDRALSAMGRRVGSRTLSLALATLEVGRETGGELPEVLRKAAAALREMTRLEGVLRTKTAEGKSQAIVICFIPAGLFFGMTAVDPEFFAPLQASPTGHLLIGICILLWLAAGFLSFKILSVEL